MDYLIYSITINGLAFLLFGIDKFKAKNKLWRIPEFTLFIVAILGGAVGSLMAMVVFKHKLSKKAFTYGIPILVIGNKLIEVFIYKAFL